LTLRESITFESVWLHYLLQSEQKLKCRFAVLTPYLPRTKVRKQKSLLATTDENGEIEDEVNFDSIRAAAKSHSCIARCNRSSLAPSNYAIKTFSTRSKSSQQNVTLAVISDASIIPYAQLPPPLLEREFSYLLRNFHLTMHTRCAFGTRQAR